MASRKAPSTPVPAAAQGQGKWKGSRPTHELAMLTKEGGYWSPIGVAWTNERGGITLKLNAGVNLNWTDTEQYKVMLFPKGYNKQDGD